jgi:hypothetical protein
MMETPSLDPVVELEAINRTLQMCEDAVRKGDRIDLNGVDEQIDLLCQEVIKSEGPLRLKLLPMLENAVQVLDRLEAGLRLSLTQEQEKEEAEKRMRANSAYGTKSGDGSGDGSRGSKTL